MIMFNQTIKQVAINDLLEPWCDAVDVEGVFARQLAHIFLQLKHVLADRALVLAALCNQPNK